MIKISDLVFKFIEQMNIDTVFTVSGGGCMHLTDSLGKNKNIRYICNHHEQACAMAAEGYSKASNKPGCVLVTTGPGGTNTLTGVLCAFQDSVPMIVLSGQVPTSQTSKNTGCRQIGQQEFNIVDTVKHMTKYAVQITNKNKILYELQKAYSLSVDGRPGPVWIDIPLDIQSCMVDENSLEEYKGSVKKGLIQKFSDNRYFSILQDTLLKCQKPVIVVGGGIRVSHTKTALLEFLQRTGIPVMTGPHSSVDIVNNDYEYYAGRFGLLGQKTSNHLIQDSDLIISLGSRLNPKMIGYDSLKFAPKAVKFIIDIDQYELNKLELSNTVFKWKIDLKDFFSLSKTIIKPYIKDWQKEVKERRSKEVLVLPKHRSLKKYVSTYVFAEKLQQHLDKDSIIVTSDGTAHVVPLKTMQLTGNQQLFSNEGTAPMGYGLPASIGAYYATNHPITCIEGDGSIMMNLQELETIRYHDIPLIIFVLNNNGYLSIRLTQNAFFGGHLVATDATTGVSIPSFKKIADCFDYNYYTIRNNKSIDKVLTKVYNKKQRCIVEIFTDPNEAHEPKVLSKGVGSDGKIIPGELTDI